MVIIDKRWVATISNYSIKQIIMGVKDFVKKKKNELHKFLHSPSLLASQSAQLRASSFCVNTLNRFVSKLF